MHDKLLKIQTELRVPKNQRNKFGNYDYRSGEDIVEAAKPLCAKEECTLTLSDEMIAVGNHNYIKATAKLQSGDTSTETYGWAREADAQKGMSDAQITGSTSSYARKYALNGLFAIDDTKDDDHTNTHGKDAVAPKPQTKVQEAQAITPADVPF